MLNGRVNEAVWRFTFESEGVFVCVTGGPGGRIFPVPGTRCSPSKLNDFYSNIRSEDAAKSPLSSSCSVSLWPFDSVAHCAATMFASTCQFMASMVWAYYVFVLSSPIFHEKIGPGSSTKEIRSLLDHILQIIMTFIWKQQQLVQFIVNCAAKILISKSEVKNLNKMEPLNYCIIFVTM